jgi:hypothetical protein
MSVFTRLRYLVGGGEKNLAVLWIAVDELLDHLALHRYDTVMARLAALEARVPESDPAATQRDRLIDAIREYRYSRRRPEDRDRLFAVLPEGG